MKTKLFLSQSSKRRTLATALVLLFSGAFSALCQQTAVWSGSTGALWSGANWNGGQALISASSTQVAFDSTSSPGISNDDIRSLYLGSIQYRAGAPSTTIQEQNGAIYLCGTGITNDSGTTQTINVIGANSSDFVEFLNTATAGNTAINISGNNMVQGPFVEFLNASTAGSANITASGSSSSVSFTGNSTASSANINASGYAAAVTFSGSATAGNAIINANALYQNLNFNNSSTACDSAINLSGTQNNFYFTDSSTAGNATIIDSSYYSTSRFSGVSTAGDASITVSGTNASLSFSGTSTGGTSNITASGFKSSVSFTGASTTGSANITVSGYGATLGFSGSATIGNTAVNLSNSTASMDISGLTSGSIALASLQGNGAVHLGNKNLTLGGNGANVTFSGLIADGGANQGTGGSITKLGAGTLTLSGSNTYSGATTLNNGTLNLSNQYAVQNSTVTMAGGSLVFDSSVGGVFTVGGLSASNSGSGYDIALQDNASGPVSLTVGNNNSNTTYAGVLSGAGSLTKNGSGTLTLSGANTYQGPTYLAQGGLNVLGSLISNAFIDEVGAGASLTFSGTSTANNATITADANATVNFCGLATAGAALINENSISDTVNFSGTSTGGNSTINGNSMYMNVNFYNTSTAGNMSINSGFLNGVNFNDSSTAGNASIVASGYQSVIAFSGSSTAGNASIVCNGQWGDLAFCGESTAGNAIIDVGGQSNGVFFEDGATGGNATIILNSSKVDISFLTTGSATLGMLEGNGALYLGANTLSIGGNGSTATFSGVIGDGGQNGGKGGSIVKTGTGAWTLTGASTYTGTTTVAQGSLIVQGALQGSTAITVDQNSVLSVPQGSMINNAANILLGGTLNGAGSVGPVTAAGGAIAPGIPGSHLTINGAVSLDGSSSFQFTLGSDISSFDSVWSGPITLAPGASLVLSDPSGLGTSFLPGDTITLFQSQTGGAPTFLGAFSNLTLPTLTSGLSWSETNLYTLGELQVVPEGNTASYFIGGLGVLVLTRRMLRRRNHAKA